MAVGTATQTVGFGDTWGGQTEQVIDYTGVASYVGGSTGGELLDPKIFGCFASIRFVTGSISDDGVYEVKCQPRNKGYTAWYARWFTVATGAEVSDATNLSAKTVKLFGFGI